LSAFADAGQPKTRSVPVEMWFEPPGKDHRARAVDNMLTLMEHVVLEASDGDTWAGEQGLLCQLGGETQLEVTATLNTLTARLTVVTSAEDAFLRGVVKSVIQENSQSRAGVTRVPHPGEATKIAGGGATTTDGRWTEDPAGFAGEAYSANKTLGNHSDPFRVAMQTSDYHRLGAFLVPASRVDAITADASGQPASLDPKPKWSLVRVTYDWDGSDYNTSPFRSRFAWNGETLATGIVPTQDTSGTESWLAAAWTDRTSASTVTATAKGAGNASMVSSVSVDAWDLSRVWALDDGERYTEFVVGHGLAQAYVDGASIVPVNPFMAGSTRTDSGAIVTASQPSYWRLTHVSEHRVELRADTDDVLRLWRNGLIEHEPPGTTFTVRPADQSHASGSLNWRPHSARDLRVGGLRDYTASLNADSSATVTGSQPGQRYGYTLGGSDVQDVLYRRTRTTWRSNL
jgi:hypothetical protein